MTLFEPSVFLKRLAVHKDGHEVFDAHFHTGVNIIRGHNSSGKTTILDFIAYTLGAEYIPWKQEALLCDWSTAEVLLNNSPITIRRPVNNKPMNPMYIFWGPYETAQKAPTTEWEIFGFRRSSSKLSFTQAILLALGLPEAQGEGASNLTMHQLLRVLYADQPSLHSPIFRNDAFDSALTRETVGAYLTGVYDDGLYVAQLQRRDLEKTLAQLEAELKSIFRVLAKSEQNTTFEFLSQEIANLEAERSKVTAELARLRTDRPTQAKSKSADQDSELRNALDAAKKRYVELRDSLAHAELEIADSLKFVQELEARLGALDDSVATRNYFGTLSFSFCPCCLGEVTTKLPANLCSLCKRPFTSAAADGQILRMRNELRIQIEESRRLLGARDAEVQRLRTALPSAKQELEGLERRYADTKSTWSTALESAIESAARRLGAIEQEIKGLFESQRLAETIRQLQAKRDDVQNQLHAIDTTIESLDYLQETRKQQVQEEVARTLSRLLRQDLNRQPEFVKAENIQFSFIDNEVSVEGSTQFSESSTVVLRHLFHVALLSASTRIRQMRLPRFLMLDGIEDGGMELERSYRLQEIIVEESERFECQYQLIFATSQIAPSLEKEAYVVGRQFSEDSRSLSIL